MTRAGLPRVVVVGLGPGGPGQVSLGALDAIHAHDHRYLRTRRHPTAGLVGEEPEVGTFDGLYESASSIDEVYDKIVATLEQAAGEHGAVLYAVPGSPLVAERTVDLLRASDAVAVEIIPALSFLDEAWDRLGVDPLASGVRLVDGHRFRLEAAGQTGPLLVGQCDSSYALSEIKLAVEEGPRVVVLQRLGLPDEAVFEVAWDDLDREVVADHLTSLWIPQLAEPVAAELVRFEELVRTLREKCPWDREQTHRSLTRHLLEETYEVLEAIDEVEADLAAGAGGFEGFAGAGGAGFEHLEEELGDLLFQVFFHTTLASEEGQFTLADVARGIHDKLVRRHPHVFGGEQKSWEEIKRAEKGRRTVMDGVPGNLPSLLYAHKVQYKAASIGFDWDDLQGPRRKLDEELAEVDHAVAEGLGPAAVTEELGDVLFTVVNLARKLKVDPEAALREATAKFRRRIVRVEELATADGGPGLEDRTPAELDVLWEAAKEQLAGG